MPTGRSAILTMEHRNLPARQPFRRVTLIVASALVLCTIHEAGTAENRSDVAGPPAATAPTTRAEDPPEAVDRPSGNWETDTDGNAANEDTQGFAVEELKGVPLRQPAGPTPAPLTGADRLRGRHEDDTTNEDTTGWSWPGGEGTRHRD